MLIRPAIGDTDPIRYRRPTPDDQFSGNILDEAMRPVKFASRLTNAGIRREPELPEHEEIVRSERPADREFEVLEDESDLDAAKARTLRQSVRIVARQAAMDPNDGIGL